MPGEKGFNYYKKNKYVPKHITVDLGGQTAAKAGGAFSSRLVMDVVDERGEKIRGFFTQNSNIDAAEEFSKQMKNVRIPQGYERLDAIRKAVQEHPSGIEKLSATIDFNCSPGTFNAIVNDANAIYRKRGMIASTLKKAYGLPDDVLSGIISDDSKVYSYLHSLFVAADEAVGDTRVHTNHQKQTKSTNINLRNNATADYSELIHKPNLIAKSTPMTVVNGDTVMHGSFMINAEGVSHDKLDDKVNGYGNKKVSLTANAIKEISDLQILDYLCANVDRHHQNMFYKLDTSDPNEVKITGVQGIDNDASFGKFDGKSINNQSVYNRMSLIDDIKYIDESTAKEIMNLSKEALGNKIRLAGLSYAEVEAAENRLTLLQEKIKSGKGITIMKSESDWQKLASGDGVKQELEVYKGFYDNNIFKIVNDVVSTHNLTVQPHLNQQNAPANTQNDVNIKGDVPLVKAISVKDNYSLGDHIDALEHIRSVVKFEHEDSYVMMDENYAAFDKKLQNVINTMNGINNESAESRMLTDNQKNYLAESLSEIANEADAYVRALPKESADHTLKLCGNAAKSIKAYCDFAVKSIREDSLEADRNESSRAYNEIRRSYNIPVTEHTFESLAGRVKGISGRSTQFYKDMMTALAAKGDLSKAGNEKQRQKMCDDLIKAAQGYLDHKVPEGVKVKLNTKEKARVQFARDMIEYAQANKEASIGKEKEKTDYLNITNFQMKCHALAEQYNNATGADAFDAAEQIRDFKDEFVKGFKNIIEVSDRYGAKHDMQAACGTMLKSGVAEFMTAFDECYDDDMVIKGENIYHRLDLDPKYADKVRSIGELGDAVVAKYNKEHPKVQEQQPQKTAVNEKKKDDVAAVPGKI